MKSLARLSGAVVLFLGFTCSANAVEVNHTYSISRESFVNMENGFSSRMSMSQLKTHERLENPVGRFFDEFMVGKSILARNNDPMQRLVSRSSYQHIAPVPEPSIYAMLGVGLGLLPIIARRRKPD